MKQSLTTASQISYQNQFIKLNEFGLMRKNFLHDKHSGIYYSLQMRGTLDRHCMIIQEKAEDLTKTIILNKLQNTTDKTINEIIDETKNQVINELIYTF